MKNSPLRATEGKGGYVECTSCLYVFLCKCRKLNRGIKSYIWKKKKKKTQITVYGANFYKTECINYYFENVDCFH